MRVKAVSVKDAEVSYFAVVSMSGEPSPPGRIYFANTQGAHFVDIEYLVCSRGHHSVSAGEHTAYRHVRDQRGISRF